MNFVCTKKTLQDYFCTLTDLQSSKMPLPIIMNWKITPRVLSHFPSRIVKNFSWKSREIISFSKADLTHTKHAIFGSSVANNLSGIHLLNKIKNFSSRIRNFYEGNKHKYNPKFCLTFWQWLFRQDPSRTTFAIPGKSINHLFWTIGYLSTLKRLAPFIQNINIWFLNCIQRRGVHHLGKIENFRSLINCFLSFFFFSNLTGYIIELVFKRCTFFGENLTLYGMAVWLSS